MAEELKQPQPPVLTEGLDGQARNPDVFADNQLITSVETTDSVVTTSREKTRSSIANLLIGTFCAVTVFCLAIPVVSGLISGFDQGFFTDVMKTTYPPLITIVSGALGYYFGSQNK